MGNVPGAECLDHHPPHAEAQRPVEQPRLEAREGAHGEDVSLDARIEGLGGAGREDVGGDVDREAQLGEGGQAGEPNALIPQASSLAARHPRRKRESKAMPTSGMRRVARWQASTRLARASVRTSESGRCDPVRTTARSSPGSRKASALAV